MWSMPSQSYSQHLAMVTDALQRYSYDGVDRLTRLVRGAANDMQGQEQWSLDATGNWRQYSVIDVDDASKNLAQSRAANRANEITDLSREFGQDWPTPQYDRAGNTTSFPQPLAPTAGFSATYDAWNRLISLTKDGESTPTAVYAYDGLTRRITTTDAAANVRHCYYTASWQAIEERLNSATTAERQFVWGLRYLDDQICRDRDTNADGTLDERLYALQDANWNLVAITTDDGTIQQRYRYTAYGQPTRLNPDGIVAMGTDSILWGYLYSGNRYDYDSGLNCIRFRCYNSVMGSWLSPDPIELASQAPPRLQTSHALYEYAYSSPLAAIDTFGLQPSNGNVCGEPPIEDECKGFNTNASCVGCTANIPFDDIRANLCNKNVLGRRLGFRTDPGNCFADPFVATPKAERCCKKTNCTKSGEFVCARLYSIRQPDMRVIEHIDWFISSLRDTCKNNRQQNLFPPPGYYEHDPFKVA